MRTYVLFLLHSLSQNRMCKMIHLTQISNPKKMEDDKATKGKHHPPSFTPCLALHECNSNNNKNIMRRFWNLALAALFFLVVIIAPVSGFASWLRCYVELDTDEVVMNHRIVACQDSKHNVQIQIKNSNENSEWSTTYKGESTLWVRLKFPEEMGQQDMQWVVEATPSENIEFVHVGPMCEGVRAFSTNEDHVILNIKDPSQEINLVAGYAGGHEAVVLSPVLVLNNIEQEL